MVGESIPWQEQQSLLYAQEPELFYFVHDIASRNNKTRKSITTSMLYRYTFSFTLKIRTSPT